MSRPHAINDQVTHSASLPDALELDIIARFEPGFAGSREEPRVLRGWIVDKVLWRGVDITSELTPKERESIERQINEEE